MAHNLATTDGRVAMAYFGEEPWHTLGTRLDNPATAREAIEAAGLNYQVQLVSLFTQDGNQVPRRQGVIRTDNNQVLGTVGQGYAPIQNAECFGFLDAVVADGGLRYHTAGALGKGEKNLDVAWIRDGFWGRRVEIACISCANNVSMAAMLANPMG